MNTTCYLVGYIDPKTRTVTHIQTASESAQSITALASQFPFDIENISAADFGLARKKMVEALYARRTWPRYGWIWDLLEDGDKEALED
jgi:hypothetical protein